MRSIAVYCGATPGNDPIYCETADRMGRTLAERGIRLVYGGGSLGMMGAVADGALAAGGEVVGVIPDFLDDRELGHSGLTEQIVVTSMHDRKIKMIELSDGFIAMPGGLGTLEEIFEVVAWSQLGRHKKPSAFLNVKNYYAGFLAELDHMVAEGFVRQEDRDRCISADSVEGVLDAMTAWSPPAAGKWGL